DLPVAGRAAAVDPIVAMMVGPDAIARTAQYLAAKNSKTEANENINVVGLDPRQFIALDVVGESLAPRVHFDYFNASEKTLAVDWLGRVRQVAGLADQPSLEGSHN